MEGQCQLLLHEYGAEIVRIYAGIVASSLFKIDIPSSCYPVRLGAQVARVEMNGEVELTEKLQPADLAMGE